MDQQRPQFGPKCGSVRLGPEMALLQTPVVEGIDHSRDDLPDADLARFVLSDPAEVLRRDHVGRQHGPALGDFDVLLLKDDLTGAIRDAGRTLFPRHLVEGVLPGNREVSAKLKIDGARLALLGFCRRHGGLHGCLTIIRVDLVERKLGHGLRLGLVAVHSVSCVSTGGSDVAAAAECPERGGSGWKRVASEAGQGVARCPCQEQGKL